MKKTIKTITLLLVMICMSSCDTEYLDPNSILEPDVTNSTENLIRLINGVQQRWSTDRTGVLYNVTNLSGLNTEELRLLNPGNLEENEILLGGTSVSGSNGILNSLWTNSLLCRKEAITIIDAAAAASSDVSAANSLKAYALFYRAMAHGTLIQYFERVPLEIIDNAPFVDRKTVLQSVLSDLETAKGYIDADFKFVFL